MKRITGEQLRAMRKKAGLTQEQLAELLGTKQATISDWERGIRKVPRHTEFPWLKAQRNLRDEK